MERDFLRLDLPALDAALTRLPELDIEWPPLPDVGLPELDPALLQLQELDEDDQTRLTALGEILGTTDGGVAVDGWTPSTDGEAS